MADDRPLPAWLETLPKRWVSAWDQKMIEYTPIEVITLADLRAAWLAQEASMSDELPGVLSDLIAEAQRIDHEKHGKALTPDEVTTLKAVAFLRRIAPYAFPDLVAGPVPKL